MYTLFMIYSYALQARMDGKKAQDHVPMFMKGVQ